MEPTINTNITIENYRKVLEAELDSVRKENLNLKIVLSQLQEDIRNLEEDFQEAQRQLRSHDQEKTSSVPLKLVKSETPINDEL